MDSRYILLNRGLGARRGLGDAYADLVNAQSALAVAAGSGDVTTANTISAQLPGLQSAAQLEAQNQQNQANQSSYTPQIASTVNQTVASTGAVLSSILPSILGPSTTGGGLALRPATVVAAPQSSFPWGTVLLVGGAGFLVLMLARRK